MTQGKKERQTQIYELFERAVRLPPNQRSDFLVQACGGEEALQAELESLVRHHEQAAVGFLTPAVRSPVRRLDLPPFDPGQVEATQPNRVFELPADSIDGYELTRELHRGGQGVVYQAIQKSTKKKVALKVMLEGPFASEKAKRRFDREIELIASLHHPNIISVFDTGESHGKYWFAMDYIRGRPLDQYATGKDLSIEDALRLFAKICEAVNYAHQRGVIHRDLKPGNILVDEQGEPHVLDFGLAKVAGAEAFGDSRPMLVSVTGQVVGTLPYMSPEQTRGDPSQIDIRTDVYSLGVILYEMLTGKYPYDVVGQMADVLRNIAESEPRKPSTIRRQINDEVETIVLKALAKEPGRRYQSAGHLSEDIHHFLCGEPLEAKRDSGWYLIRKAARRHRLPLGVAAMGATAIVATVCGTTIYQYRQTAEILKAFTTGTLHHEALEFEAAAQNYGDAARQWPKFFAAWYWRGAALYGLKKDEAALKALGMAKELEPSDWRPLKLMALVYDRKGQHDKGNELFREYLAEYSDNLSARTYFAWSLLTASEPSHRDLSTAMEMLNYVRKPGAESQDIDAMYALACYWSGSVPKGRNAITKLLLADKPENLMNNPFHLVVLAVCEWQDEHVVEADTYLKQARNILEATADEDDKNIVMARQLLKIIDKKRAAAPRGRRAETR
jgi:serine/threonine protein kinase